jgi:calcineurin-like phosphoesterase family protein
MRLNIDLTQGKTPKNVFFTSDFHLFHNNVLKFDNRPFADVHEMHKVLEERWNETVSEDDIVIYLGDLSFARKQDKAYVDGMMWSLNGTIHYVMGNHDDYREIVKEKRYESVQDYLEVRITHMLDGKRVETLFCCMHYPIYEWNKKHRGSWLIHGHCHMDLFNEDEKWVSDINSFSEYIPKEKLEEYKSLIKQRHYYKQRVFDVGCMGWDYRPVSYLDVLKLGENRVYGTHH